MRFLYSYSIFSFPNFTYRFIERFERMKPIIYNFDSKMKPNEYVFQQIFINKNYKKEVIKFISKRELQLHFLNYLNSLNK